jgi:hypothetical protein
MLKGFFSIIQFSPDPARNEAINIGILLAVPELNFLDLKITENLTRVKSVMVTKTGTDFLKTAITAFDFMKVIESKKTDGKIFSGHKHSCSLCQRINLALHINNTYCPSTSPNYSF